MKLAAIATTVLALSGSAFAQANLPAPQNANGLTYLCGGVTTDESDAMKAASKDYDLMATFAAQDGSYVADVKVSLEDAGGKSVLQTTCAGPIMLVKLAHAGSYRIRAELGGNAQVKTVQVQPKAGARSVSFTWPVNRSESATPGSPLK